MANIFKAKTLVSRTGIFSHEVIAPNLVYNTGNQIISGNKTFVNNVAISGTGIFSSVKVSNIDKLLLSGIDVVISGNSSVNVYNQIYISGNPVLTGVIPTTQTISNVVYTTGNQTIAGDKTFTSVLGVRTISGLQAIGGDSLNLIAANDWIVNPGNTAGGDINLTAGTGENIGNSDYGEINLYAAGPKYQGNINLNGNINVNKVQYFPAYGDPASMASRTINIYKTGDSFQSFVGLTIDNESISLHDLSYAGIGGFGLYISGVGVTPALYANINNLFATGSTLDNKINSLSSDTIVYTTGSQTISGEKVFRGNTSLYNVYLYSGLVFRKGNTDSTDVDIELLNRPYGRSFVSIGSNTSKIGPSINEGYREVKIWETGGYTAGPWLYKMARFGPLATILSEDSFSKVGIGTLFPTEKVHISGGNLKVDGEIYFSGNLVLTGVDLTSYATVSNLFETGSRLDNKINSLSGYVNSQDTIFSGQIGSTGSLLDSKINSLSGTLTGNYATIINLFSTGSTLDSKINNLSGYVNSQNILFSGQIASTGSRLDNKINALSGVSVLTFGDQTIYGNKNFLNNIGVSGTGVFNAIDLNNVDILSISGVDVSIVNGNVSLTNRPTVNGTGVVLSGELEGMIINSGSLLNNKINSLSGFLNDNVVYVTGNQNIDGNKNFYNIPTINGDGILSSGQDIIGGDLTGDLLSATINKLQGYPVNITTPSQGQVLSWNGSSWAPGANANGGGGGGGLFYYFNFGNHTGIAPSGGLPTTGYSALSLLGRAYDIGAGEFTSPDLTPKDQFHLVTHFVSASGDPGVKNIPAGLWDFNIWANTNTTNATQTQMKAVVNIYDPINSSYRYVGESDAVYLYDRTTPAQYILNVTMPQTGIQDYERIYIQLFGQKTTNLTRTITFYFDSYRPSHVHTTIPSIAGSGVVKVVDGIYQTPATLIFNTDVDNNANIAQTKIANLTTDLSNLDNKYSALSGNLIITGSILDQKINSLSGWAASADNLFLTGSSLNNKIDSLSGSAVLTYGNQNVYGIKYFYSGVVITGDGSTNGGHSLVAKNSAGTNGLQFNPTQEGGAGNLYFNAGTTSRLYNVGDSTLQFYANSNQYRVANSLTISNGSDIPDHTVYVVNRYGYFGIGSGFSNPLERLHVSGGNLRVDGKILLSGNPVLTGVDLSSYATKSAINSLSGQVVFTTGNQIISGIKTFVDNTVFGDPSQGDFLVISGNTFTIYGSGNFTNGLFVSGVPVLTGLPNWYATSTDLALTGSILNNKINNLSGFINDNVVFTTGNQTILGQKTFSGTTTVIGHFAATSKSFLIDHPLDNNKKLQYASLEGPEHGVFLRGKTNENIINLPNYWSALVDENTISVNLTPINVYSNIYVVDYNNSRIITNGNNGNYYFYTIYGERKDIPKLTVEF